MKKFPLCCAFLLFCVYLSSAQSPANYLSASAGPNFFFQSNGKKSGITQPEGGWGYTVGAAYARKISAHWRLQVDVHYNEWREGITSGPLQFPSENQNGVYVYDPTLQHYITSMFRHDAYQILCGAGWYSSPKKWQWNISAALGNSFIESTNESLGYYSRFTGSISAGLALRIKGNLQWTLQPAFQQLFRKAPGYAFTALQLETGLRMGF